MINPNRRGGVTGIRSGRSRWSSAQHCYLETGVVPLLCSFVQIDAHGKFAGIDSRTAPVAHFAGTIQLSRPSLPRVYQFSCNVSASDSFYSSVVSKQVDLIRLFVSSFLNQDSLCWIMHRAVQVHSYIRLLKSFTIVMVSDSLAASPPGNQWKIS